MKEWGWKINNHHAGWKVCEYTGRGLSKFHCDDDTWEENTPAFLQAAHEKCCCRCEHLLFKTLHGYCRKDLGDLLTFEEKETGI